MKWKFFLMVIFGQGFHMFCSSPSQFMLGFDFVDSNWPISGEVYEQMDTMLGKIKDIVQLRYMFLYNYIGIKVENGGKS